MSKSICRLLGLRLENVVLQPFVGSLSGRPHEEEIDDRLYTAFYDAGICFIAQLDRTVKAIQLYSDGYQGYCGFRRPLPAGLAFADGRAKVHQILGEPTASGGGEHIPLFGQVPPWDAYDRIRLN